MLTRKKAPIEDYSSVPLGALRQCVRHLDAEQMRQLIAFEECHAGRHRALEVLHDRLYQLEHGVEPSVRPRGEVPHGALDPDLR
ncbi:hypothetical protein [Nocardiopsis ganjiahuensis]|uniref:hypothetical protein n=1 Tax=Nocardiopsis ganjiahuensis TaxID=239984 RepID=UPI00034589C5|nr:hypothetical protein [Nocardiopsis ganjiahuensis]